MKVLVYVTYAINTPHFETELEIIQHHLDAGDEVSVVGCNASLLCCDVNWNHDVVQCIRCIARRVNGLERLDSKIRVLPQINLNEKQKEEINAVDNIPLTIPDMKKMEIDGFDIGFGVLSSLVSWQRDPDLDLKKIKEIVRSLYLSAFCSYRTLQNYLDNEQYDRVYVYNGRYAPMRAVLRACQSRGIDCYTQEKGSSLNKYALWKNTTVHDLENTARLINEHWNTDKNKEVREVLAHQFYMDRVEGVSRNWIAFCAEHEADRLPDDWDETKINISIYVSSEDEFVAIGDAWQHPIYDSQSQGITKIIQETQKKSNIHYYLRVHPNLKNIDNSQTRSLNKLKFDNLTIIPAESTISTYALLNNSDKVVTFGSTVGIEATYWGIPSVMVGQSMYRFLDATYNPATHEEVMALIHTGLLPKDKTPTLKYGYYWQTFGIDFKHYEPKGIYEGLFKGYTVAPSMFFRVFLSLLSSRIGHLLSPSLRRLSLRKNCAAMGVDSFS